MFNKLKLLAFIGSFYVIYNGSAYSQGVPCAACEIETNQQAKDQCNNNCDF